MMLKKLRRLYYKTDMDYSKGQVDLYKFHPTFYFFMKAFQVINNEEVPKWSYFNLLFTFINGVIGIVMAGISFGRGIATFDISHTTETGTYFMILSYKLLILYNTKQNKTELYYLVTVMKDDFTYICNEGKQYRERFFQNQLITWQICLCSLIFTISIAVAMVGFASIFLLWFVVFHTATEGESRPLVFPFWAWNTNFGKSPLYEVMFMFCNLCISTFCSVYIFMLQTQIIWVRHLANKAELVKWQIQDLLIDVHPTMSKEENEYFKKLVTYRFSKIVIQHQSLYCLLEAYAKTYRKFLMFEQKVTAPLLCLTSYCVAQKLDVGEFHAFMLTLTLGVFVQVLIPNYLCTYLEEKVTSVCSACWDTPFWNSGSYVRLYMVLIMQRSLRPLNLHAPGFEPVCIQTFSNKVMSAYSLFNMLRHTNL